MRRPRHWRCSTLISHSTILSQLACFGVKWNFEAAQDARGLGGREGLIQRPRLMDRQIVLHDTDAGGVGIMDVEEITDAVGVVHGGAAVGDLEVAPAPMSIEGDEEIGGAVAAILVIVGLALSRLGRDRLAHLADQLDGILVETDQRPGGILRLGVEVEHVLHAGNYSPSTWGMHHMSLRHGLRSFSASRRRTVSPDRLL